MGREPGGWGLAATPQLVAGDPIPPARPSDGGEEILLDTHSRTQLGTSPGGSRREPGGGRDSTSRGEPGAHAAWPRRLQDPGRKDPSLTDCRSFRLTRRKQAAQGPVTRTQEVLRSALRVWGRAGARVGRGGCSPPPAEPLRAQALRGLGLPRSPLPCPRRGSAPCRTWLQPPGEVRETRPKLHYFSPASSPSWLPAPDLAAAAAACVWGPPASYSHARTHSPAGSLAFEQPRSPRSRSPDVRNYCTDCQRDCWRRPVARRDPPLAPAPWAPAHAAAAAAGDVGEQGALPASRRGGARAQGAEAS